MSSENLVHLPTSSDSKAATSMYSDHMLAKQQQQQQQQQQQHQHQQPKIKISSSIQSIEEKSINNELKPVKPEKEIKELEKKESLSAFTLRRRRDRRGNSNNTTNDGRKWKRKRDGYSTNMSIGVSSGCSSSSSTSPGNSSPGSCSSSSCSSSDGEDDEVLGASCNNSFINNVDDRSMNSYTGGGNFDGNNINNNSPPNNTIGICIGNPLPLHHPLDDGRNDDNENEIIPEEEKSSDSAMSQQHQPAGWRVKLYRLNADGSWDDCGTGRITCSVSNIGKMIYNSKESLGLQSDEAIYAELGDPTLNMLAEILNTDTTKSEVIEDHSTNSNAKVLLNTRVLLRESYQRQGDNIITWCEPFFSKDSNISSSILASAHKLIPGGVDLALSFQDNAGCLEIWTQITEVQGRAMNIMRNRAKAANIAPSHPSLYCQKSEVDVAATKTMDSYSNQDSRTDVHMMSNNNDEIKKNGDIFANINPIPATEDGTGSNGATTLDPHHLQQQHKQPDFWNQISQSPKTANATASSSSVTFDNGEVYPDSSLLRFESTAPTASHPTLTSCVASASLNPLGEYTHPSNTTPHLPTPTLHNLEEVADLIAAAQMHQREQLALLLSSNECAYLLSLLSLFPYAEKNDDFRSLATLAACIKSILLLNDPTIIELIVSEFLVFENVCSVLEYDPDLRIKANHRWFIREQSKFRTVLKMEKEDLVNVIFRSFRVSYLRDTLLRPTMDESSLSTLASLLQFTHSDVVRGVTCSDSSINNHAENDNVGEKCMLSSESSSVIDHPCATNEDGDSYLVKVMRLLGRELRAIYSIESNLMSMPNDGIVVDGNTASSSDDSLSLSEVVLSNTEQHQYSDDHDQRTMQDKKFNIRSGSQNSAFSDSSSDINSVKNTPSSDLLTNTNSSSSHWKQQLLPQDESLSSRKIRRKGCLSFLKELFHMVRNSLQQGTKDDFYNMIVLLDVPLLLNQLKDDSKFEKENYSDSSKHHVQESSKDSIYLSVNLLSLLGSVLFDTNTEVSERSCALEILSAIVIHDSSVIRRHCLDFFASKNNHNDNSDVASHINTWPGRPKPNEKNGVMFRYGPDDLLLSLLHVMAVEKDAGLLLQASEIIRIILDTEMLAEQNNSFKLDLDDCDVTSNSITGISSDQNSFLAMFYEHYIQWLLVPFQYTVLIPVCCPPFEDQQCATTWNVKMQVVAPCAVRACFTVELLSFCVRAHCYRMKAFVLKNRILSIILSLLSPSAERIFFGQRKQQNQLPRNNEGVVTSGGRCFTLAALRFLRSALCIRDEFYNRYIIQNNLFKYVFEAFRANPVGDNLVASSIAEMCDFIHAENIESLMEHIVERHLSISTVRSQNNDESAIVPSLEEFATPYVDIGHFFDTTSSTNIHQNRHNPRVGMSQKALEDQRKFRENDEEDSYFNNNDDDDVIDTSPESAVDDGFQFTCKDQIHAIGNLLNEDSSSNSLRQVHDL